MLPQAKTIVDGQSVKMQSAVDFLEEDLKNYRVGKASPAILNPVMVDYYGTATPVSQVASITTPDAKTLAKEFDDCVVYIGEDAITVAVPAPMEGLSEEAVARITDVICTETSYGPEQLNIIEVKA